METKTLTLEEKKIKCAQLSYEIARLHKILSMRQTEFNKLDTEIFKELKALEDAKEQPQEDN